MGRPQGRGGAALQADPTTRGLPPGHPKVQEHEAAVAALNASKDAVAHGAWMATARDVADLELLAEVVFDYFFDIATFPQLPADIDDRDDQQVAVAYLLREVFAVSQSYCRWEEFMTAHTHQNGPADRTAGEKALADWREAVAKEIAALEASDAAPGDADLQHAYRAAVEHSRQVARLAWTRLIGPADVRVRAEIARHCLWPRYHGERRFEAVIGGKEFDDGLELGEFDERAVAELVRAVLWTVKTAPARPAPPARDWLALLRDAGPNGAAPDPRHAAIWGAILDLRGCRDAIENTVEQMTEKLNWLADETTLTHAIAAGWEPDEDDTAEREAD